MNKIDNSFSLIEASELCGLTAHMVRYLVREEIVRPICDNDRGRGRGRILKFRFGDVVMLRTISKFLSTGIEVKKLQKALQNISKYHQDITPSSLPAKYIVTDGKEVYFKHDNEVLEGLSKGQFAFTFILEVAAIRSEVINQIKKNAEEQPKSNDVLIDDSKLAG